jgi:hypothetical protein
MSVGLAADKASIDQRIGSIALDLRNVFERIATMQQFLAGQTDQALQGAGYTVPSDIALLKSGSSDMDLLRQIYEGTATQATLKDFRTFIKQFTGCV